MEEQTVYSTPLFLTAAEKKKLQWEKERGCFMHLLEALSLSFLFYSLLTSASE